MSAERELAISARNLGVSYWMKKGAIRHRRFWALEDVSFELYRGDSLGVVGMNGAGKSTLLRLLAGVMSPDRGTLINHGVSCSLLSLSLGFLPYLSGRENAILGGMFQGLTKESIESKMDDIIDFSELEEFIDEPISSYSSGMKARLAFSLAFQVNADVLLIDEVIGVGDQAFQQKSVDVMKERIRADHNTIVFVSHSANVVRELCNRAIWIEDRVIRAEGDTDEVLQQYQDYLKSRASARSAPKI